MRALSLLLFAAVAAAPACGDDDCGPSPCGACPPACVPVDRCDDGEWQCECDCSTDDAATTDAPPPSCISGGTSGCTTDTPCCSPYTCSSGYCCGGSPPNPHWDCL